MSHQSLLRRIRAMDVEEALTRAERVCDGTNQINVNGVDVVELVAVLADKVEQMHYRPKGCDGSK